MNDQLLRTLDPASATLTAPEQQRAEHLLRQISSTPREMVGPDADVDVAADRLIAGGPSRRWLIPAAATLLAGVGVLAAVVAGRPILGVAPLAPPSTPALTAPVAGGPELTPTELDPDEATELKAACQLAADGPRIDGATMTLAQRYAADMVAVLATTDGYEVRCYLRAVAGEPLSDARILGTGRRVPAGWLGAREVSVEIVSFQGLDADTSPIMIWGVAGSDVTSVVVHTSDQSIRATPTASGSFLAWAPTSPERPAIERATEPAGRLWTFDLGFVDGTIADGVHGVESPTIGTPAPTPKR